MATNALEKDKWDEYYENLSLTAPDESLESFSKELAEWLCGVLPAGSRILEAGCGGGLQSLELARTGHFEVTLLDFSPKALDYASRIFQKSGLKVNLIQADAFVPGDPEYDLVYNAGVLEHYSFEDQVRFLKGMRSRSRNMVLAMVPNGQCYWYWHWRLRASATGNWPWGKEVPQAGLEDAFRTAGLAPLETRYLGAGWTENFIRQVCGDPELAATMIETHRSGMLPPRQTSYLTCQLGRISEPGPAHGEPASMEMETLRADFADAVAAKRAAQAEVASRKGETDILRGEVAELRDFRERAMDGIRAYRHELHRLLLQAKGQRAWQVMLLVRKMYVQWHRPGLAAKIQALFLPWQVVRKQVSLEDVDFRFPDISQYLPASMGSVRSGSGSTSPLNALQKVGAPPTGKYDVILLPIIDFEFRFQRPQHIAMQFSKAGHRVFWVTLARDLGPHSESLFEVAPLRDNVWELRLSGEALDLFGGNLSRNAVERRVAGLLEFCKYAAVSELVTLLHLPSWRKIAVELRDQLGARLVYDMMDDWQNWPTEPKFGKAALDAQEQLFREVDVFAVTARDLAERYADRGKRPLLIPNAADFERFHRGTSNGELQSVRRPIIGYYGALAAWVDIDLLNELARQRPNYSFVLIGPAFDVDLSVLRKLPNVQLPGEKRFEELPGYLADFDVCLVPFRMNELTHAVDPVKLYEYLSQGKPVVATRMRELEPLSDFVYLASGPQEALAKLDEAVAEKDASLRERRIEFASRNTWKHRFETLSAAIDERFPRVSLIVVTHNSQEFIRPLTGSLLQWPGQPNVEIVVVDNASTDGTPEALREAAARDPRIRLFPQSRNLGFAGGNNLGVRESTGEYVILLNADTIVTPGWIGRLLKLLRLDPRIGLAAPVTNWSGNETKIDSVYQDTPTLAQFSRSLAIEKCGESLDIEVAPLLCGALRREVWEEINGLDEAFAIGMFEDDDFCRRLKQAGYRVVTAEDCFIHHFGMGSFGKLSEPDYKAIFDENRTKFDRKWPAAPWRVHQLRPGVRPLEQERRLKPGAFLFTEAEKAPGTFAGPG